jgi:hypothetical protein
MEQLEDRDTKEEAHEHACHKLGAAQPLVLESQSRHAKPQQKENVGEQKSRRIDASADSEAVFDHVRDDGGQEDEGYKRRRRCAHSEGRYERAGHEPDRHFRLEPSHASEREPGASGDCEGERLPFGNRSDHTQMMQE